MTINRSRFRPGSSDRGITLIELVVSMAILGIVLTIVTGAMISMYRATDKAEGITSTSAQVNMALTKLDSSVRYAAEISEPIQKSGDWYVTYRSTYSGVTDCKQLRFNMATRQLQWRGWTAGAGASPSAWSPLASELHLSEAGGSPATPFVITTSRGTEDLDAIAHQQLRVRFDAVSGEGDRKTTSATDVTFTAFNARVGGMSPSGTGSGATCDGMVTP